jgi:accessory gene regulator B
MPYKIALAFVIWIYAISTVFEYAPADTEDVPVISKKERKKRKFISYFIVTAMLIIGCIVPNNMISNILIFGAFLQTITITRIAYKLTRNKYGYEEYMINKDSADN